MHWCQTGCRARLPLRLADRSGRSQADNQVCQPQTKANQQRKREAGLLRPPVFSFPKEAWLTCPNPDRR